MRRFLPFFLLLAAILPAATNVKAQTSGSCGDGVTFSYDGNTGTLTIKGNGTITSNPWTTSMQSLVIEDGVDSIAIDKAFYYCYNLKEITLPANLKNTGNYAFANCTSLTNVVIPAKIINDGAFQACTKLTKVELTENVDSVGDMAFNGCSAVTEFIINEGLRCIGGYGLFGMSSLASITLPKSLEFIGSCAFGKSQIKTIETSARVIGGSAFQNTTSLEKLILKEGVDSIGGYILAQTKNKITEIILPNTLEHIGPGAFAYMPDAVKSIELPASVKTIGEKAFYENDSLQKIILNEGLEEIGESAFFNCISLKNITLPNSVKTIGAKLFIWCDSLESVTLSENLEAIPEQTFYGCRALENVTIPAKVKSVGKWLFGFGNGTTDIKPKNITFLGTTAPTIDYSNGAYLRTPDVTLYYPAGCDYSEWVNHTKSYATTESFYEQLTVSSVGYSTLYSTQNLTLPEEIKAYYIKETTNNSALLTEISGDILPSGTGVVIEAEQGTYNLPVTTETSTAVEGNMLTGTNSTINTADAKTEYSGKEIFSLKNGANGLGFYIHGNETLAAGKAYLPLDAATELNSLALRFDEATTAITETKTDDKKDRIVYDLSGRQVNSPAKGIYIINGKKTIIK